MNKSIIKMIFVFAVLIVILAVGLTHLSEIIGVLGWVYSLISPLVLGLCMAFIFNIIMTPIEKVILRGFDKGSKKWVKKLKRPLAIVLTMLVVFGFVTAIFAVIIPAIADSVDIMIQKFPGFLAQAQEKVETFIHNNNIKLEFIEGNKINWTAVGERVIDWLKNNTNSLVNVTAGVAANMLSVVVNFILAFVFSLYILARKEQSAEFLHTMMKAFLKPRRVAAIERISGLTYRVFARFFIGQLTEAVILGVLCFIGMLIFRFPMASVVSVIVGVTALVPIFGAWIGGALGALLILMDDPMKALFFIVFILILQQLEGNIIYPKVVGESIGLPSMLVLCAVTVGTGLGGIPGLLFSVPTTSVIYILLKEKIGYRNESEDEANSRSPKEKAAETSAEEMDTPTEKESVPAEQTETQSTPDEEKGPETV